MSLSKQAIAIQLRGLNTKAANALRLPGELERATNVYMDKTGELRKRSGSAMLAMNGYAGASSGARLSSIGQHLIHEDGISVHEYSAGSGYWNDVGARAPLYATSLRQMSDGGVTNANPDVKYCNGFVVAAWQATNGIFYTIQDEAGRSPLVAPALAISGGSNPKLVAVGTKVIIFGYTAAAGVVSRTIDCASVGALLTLGTQQNVYASAAVGSALNWDAIEHDSTRARVCARTTTSLSVQYWTPAGVASNAGVVTITSSGVANQGCIGWMTNFSANGSQYIAVNSPTPALRAVEVSGSPFTLVSDVLVSSAGVTDTLQPIGFTYGLAPTVVCKLNLSGNSVGSRTLPRMLPASRVFAYNSDAYALFLNYDTSATALPVSNSPLPAYLLYNFTQSRIEGTFLLGHGPVIPQATYGTPTISATSGKFLAAVLRRTRVGVTITSFQRVVSATAGDNATLAMEIDFTAGPSLGPCAELGGVLFMPGGNPKVFDGISAYSVQAMAPEKPVLTGAGSGAYAYQYCATLEWQDSTGNVHRSAPSIPVTYLNAAAPTSPPSASVTVSSTATTTKSLTTILWRTKANGSEFQRLPATALITSDLTTDATLSAQEFLYTTGGVVENMAAPPCRVAASHLGRMWVASSEFTSELWYSKVFETNICLEFNGAMSFDVGSPADGGITALASMDDKLVVFKKNAIYYIYGEGPSLTGEGEFSDPVRLPTEFGTIAPRSVVSTPDGVFFQNTTGGIYMVTRSLDVTYIGAPVKDFEAQKVTGAVYVPTYDQVRFSCSSGSTLVYDRKNQQWFDWTAPAAVGACLLNGAHYWLNSAGDMYYETKGVYGDSGTAIVSTVKLAPISLSSLQGFARLYDVYFLSERRGAHLLTTRLYYDYSLTAGDTETVTPPAGISMISTQPKLQRCSAVQIEAFDTPTGAVDGFALSGITLNIGAKGRLSTPVTRSTPQ